MNEAILTTSPIQFHINRTAYPCPNVPREVGDGMEKVSPIEPVTGSPFRPKSISSSGYSTPNYSPRLMLEVRSDKDSEYLQQEDVISIQSSIDVPGKRIQESKFLQEETEALKNHLKIQIQVNQELKRLLVASIGEDIGFHYERIATEKAQLQMENEEWKKKLSAQEEESERLNISCDIWRSKFLASRVQCDETQETLLKLQKTQREMETAVRGLLREHRTRSEHLEETHETLTHLYGALQWGKKPENMKQNENEKNEASVDEECLTLANKISSQLLGISSREPSKRLNYKKYMLSWNRMSSKKAPPPPEVDMETDVKLTLAEKYVLQLLRENSGVITPSSSNLEYYPQSKTSNIGRKASGTVLGRFHPHTKYENITLACCSKCKGDIHLV